MIITIYACVFGKWINIDDEKYAINGETPSTMIKNFPDPECYNHSNGYFELYNRDTEEKIYIHYSLIQWSINTAAHNFTNEEKW